MNSIILPNYNHVFVIGNGFDLACNLPTSHTDFLNSSQFSILESDKNSIAQHLREKHELQRWTDIEQEFSVLSKNNKYKTEDFHQEYKELRFALIRYINNIDYSSLNREVALVSKISSLINHGTVCILNFNYTRTIEELFKDGSNNLIHIHVHGSASNNNVVFGVHDKATIDSEHVFLRKAYSQALSTDSTVGEIMSNVIKSVSIFGHSLGETDTN